MDDRQLLHGSFLFRQLDPRELEELERIVSVRTLSKDQLLFTQGDNATGFFVLLSGSVRIYKASADGREYTLHRITPGQMFAEAAIFDGVTFPANAVTTGESVVAYIPKDQFINLITQSPQISLKMIAALAGFVRDFNQQIEDLSLKEVSARLASFILRKVDASDGDTLTLETTKSELARSLGTTSESLSRNLRKMRDLKIIENRGNLIEVLKRDHLRSIAEGEKI